MGVARKGRIQNDSCISAQLDAGSRDGWGRTGVGKDKSFVTDVVHGERMVGIQEQMAGGCLSPEFWGEVCAEHEFESPGGRQTVLVLCVG